MTKKLDEKSILNELRGESAFFKPSPTEVQDAMPQRDNSKERKKKVVQPGKNQDDKNPDHLVDQSINQPIDQLANQPSNNAVGPSSNRVSSRSVEPSIRQPDNNHFDMTPVLPKPKGFYITEKQDEELNILVKKLSDRLKGKVGQKIDRSVVTRLIFENIDLMNDETVKQLASLMISRLASQLTSRQPDELAP